MKKTKLFFIGFILFFSAQIAFSAIIAEQNIKDLLIAETGGPREVFEPGGLSGELKSITLSIGERDARYLNNFRVVVVCFPDYPILNESCLETPYTRSNIQKVQGSQKDYTFTFAPGFVFKPEYAYMVILDDEGTSNGFYVYGSRTNSYSGAMGTSLNLQGSSFYSGSSDLYFIIHSTASEPTVENLTQLKSDTTALPEGGVLNVQDSIVFQGTVQSSSSLAKLQVEVKPIDEDFDGGLATSMIESPLQESGSKAVITKSALPLGHYKWRARAIDSEGNHSLWREFGNNKEADFIQGNVGAKKIFGNTYCNPGGISGGNFGMMSGTQKQGLVFSIPDINTLNKITIGFTSSPAGRIFKVGNPTDGVKISIRSYPDTSTVLGESTIVPADEIANTQAQTTLQTFTFDNLKLTPDTKYLFLLERTGSLTETETDYYFNALVMFFLPSCPFSGDAAYYYERSYGNGFDPTSMMGFNIQYTTPPPVFKTLNPVVLLPGIGGSWTDNLMDLLTRASPVPQSDLKFTEKSGASLLKVLNAVERLPQPFRTLEEELTSLGYKVYECPYDWRQQEQYIAENYLKPCIDRAKSEAGTDKVDIAAHSLGGLVAREYLQGSEYRDDVDKLALIGTPNHGSVDSYSVWESGSYTAQTKQTLQKFILNRLFDVAGIRTGTSTLSFVHSYIPSLQSLLPTFDYLTTQDGTLRGSSAMYWKNDWLKSLNTSPTAAHLASKVETKLFVAEGLNTLSGLTVRFPNLANSAGDLTKSYPDGKGIHAEVTTSGDGTVLSESARLPEALIPSLIKTGTNELFTHTNLPNAFHSEVLEFLTGTGTTSLPFSPKEEPDSMLLISLASPAELLVTDSVGRKTGFNKITGEIINTIPNSFYSGLGEEEFVLIMDPEYVQYEVRVEGNASGVFHTGASYANDICSQSANNIGQTTPTTTTTFIVSLSNCVANSEEQTGFYSLVSKTTFIPTKVNLNSLGQKQTVKSRIELPLHENVFDIIPESLRLQGAIIPKKILPVFEGTEYGTYYLDVKWSAEDIESLVKKGINMLTVSGILKNGTTFAGQGALEILK